MIDRLRRLDAWLGARGIRRSVLLTLGSAGLVAVGVAALAWVQLGRVADAAPAADRVAADVEALQASYWRARFEALTGDPHAARAGQEVSSAATSARALPLTAAQTAALADFTGAWQQGQPARRSSARAAAALDSLVSLTHQGTAGRRDAAGRAYVEGRGLLLLVIAIGLIGTLGLVRLLVGCAIGWGHRMLDLLAGAAGPDAEGASDGTAASVAATDEPASADLAAVARSVAQASTTMRATVRWMQERERRERAAAHGAQRSQPTPATRDALTGPDGETAPSWWLEPAPGRGAR